MNNVTNMKEWVTKNKPAPELVRLSESSDYVYQSFMNTWFGVKEKPEKLKLVKTGEK